MAKKQTRRSVSIRGATYEKVRAYCERHDLSMSEFVEDLIGQFFSGHGATLSAPAGAAQKTSKASAKRSAEEQKLSTDELHDAARFFTF